MLSRTERGRIYSSAPVMPGRQEPGQGAVPVFQIVGTVVLDHPLLVRCGNDSIKTGERQKQKWISPNIIEDNYGTEDNRKRSDCRLTLSLVYLSPQNLSPRKPFATTGRLALASASPPKSRRTPCRSKCRTVGPLEVVHRAPYEVAVCPARPRQSPAD